MMDTQKNISINLSRCSDIFGQDLYSIFIMFINNIIISYISHFLLVNPNLIKPDEIQIRP